MGRAEPGRQGKLAHRTRDGVGRMVSAQPRSIRHPTPLVGHRGLAGVHRWKPKPSPGRSAAPTTRTSSSSPARKPRPSRRCYGTAAWTARTASTATWCCTSTTATCTSPPVGIVAALEGLCKPGSKVLEIATPWGGINCAGAGSLQAASANHRLAAPKDPRIALVNITFAGGGSFDQQAINRVYDTLDKLKSNGLEVEFTGDAFAGQRGSSGGGVSPEMLGFIAAFIILAVVFRTVGAIALPLASAVAALVSGLGVIALLSHAMNVSTVTPELAQLMVIGVGIDYALFIVTKDTAATC